MPDKPDRSASVILKEAVDAVFVETGIKVDTDDPLVAVLAVHRRYLEQPREEWRQEQTEQMQAFLERFEKTAAAIAESAEELENNRQIIMAEIMNANSKEIAAIEDKLLGSAGLKIQKQFRADTEDLLDRIRRCLIQAGVLLVTAQILLLSAVVWISGK